LKLTLSLSSIKFYFSWLKKALINSQIVQKNQ
jgi:hypothetical protein